MHIEAVAATRTGPVGCGKRRMAVAHEYHAREIAAHERFERRAQPGEIAGQVAVEDVLGVRDRGHVAAAPEQQPLGGRLDDDVGDKTREQDVVGADGEQDEVEAAVGAVPMREREQLGQFGDLGAYASRAGGVGARTRAFAAGLGAKEAARDGRARAGQRHERHGETGILDRQRQRGAHLVAVERAVAGPALPARALARPVVGAGIFVTLDDAGSVAGKAVAGGPVVFVWATAEKTPEAEAAVRKAHWPIRIAFAGRDRIAEPCDQHIAHRDLGHHALCRTVGKHDIDADERRAPISDTQLDLFIAWHGGAARLAFAVIKTPGAGDVGGDRTGKHDPDRVLARRQIDFTPAVAVAKFHQLASTVDAQPLDHIARPAAAVRVARKPLLGAEHAIVAIGGDMTIEVGLAAKQAEPVLDLPVDAQGRGAAALGERGAPARRRQQKPSQPENPEGTHDARRG